MQSHLRTNDSSYAAAWRPYIRAVNDAVRTAQITHGGPVIAVQIDNEYVQDEQIGYPGKAKMFEDIEQEMRDGGIDVPLTFNDAYQGGNFVNGTGAVDLWGLDSYPQVRIHLNSHTSGLPAVSSDSIVPRQMYGSSLSPTIMTFTCIQIVRGCCIR